MKFYLIVLIVISIFELISCSRKSGRILGGNLVTAKEQESYNYQVRLVSRSSQRKGVGYCGGTLIAPNWVLTAGHCLLDEDVEVDETKLYFGVTSLLKLNEGEQRIVKKNDFIIHKDWDPESLLSLHDIALIRLKDPVKLSKKIGIVGLPSKKDTCLSNEGKTVTVSGWGMSDDNENTKNNILKSANVKVATVRDCKKTWGDGMNPNNMVCASADNYQGTCEGDSGGPMVLKKDNGEKILIGITSFGMDKCKTKDHRIFTCVYAHKKWIETQTKLKF